MRILLQLKWRLWLAGLSKKKAGVLQDCKSRIESGILRDFTNETLVVKFISVDYSWLMFTVRA